ncbi:hypothetical protein [Chitinophaga nivalis]|uniref:Uncharacterized protein n=1 Tax=Chitinophaga nivalis TaxID=2991709 RepID=A0ABT3IHZ8_9BACT|nr:hypothetical protein [Chitinophaga nivalis]MCW3466719.1 hypothetical protein [Chitinophaga nivalis]MCW3483590.1 hypothetical protein [Chitinophaga nivalis]
MTTSLSATQLIPPQKKGGQSNTSSTRTSGNATEAGMIYQTAKDRLLDVNHWQEFSGGLTASFTLVDENGKLLRRHAREGDHIRVKIPAPGTDTGEGYDWVCIEQIQEAENDNDALAYIGMRVRPFPAPAHAHKEVAHFFRAYASSSFMVVKKGNKIIASVFGRNEIPNTTVRAFTDKLRNLLIGFTAILGFSKVQWKKLVNGLLKSGPVT